MQNQWLSRLLTALTGLGIVAGLILTFLSWIGACSNACIEGHAYRFFGLHFEFIGFVYFILLLASYILSFWYPTFTTVTGLLLAAGVGSEIMFILIQKYAVGAWCPICLSIAASVFIAAGAWAIGYIRGLTKTIQQGNRSDIMQTLKRSLTSFAALTAGLLLAFFGVTKHDDLMAAEETFQQKIEFGNQDSPIEIYVFTSWICPACSKFEPTLEEMAPKLMKDAKIIFVDYGVDDTTMNFLPYNLSFMLHQKPQYIPLRRAIKEMAKETEEPEEKSVEAAAAKLGVKYKQINYADVAAGIELFKELATDLKIRSLPSMVIVDTRNKKIARLSGLSELTLENVQETLNDVKKQGE